MQHGKPWVGWIFHCCINRSRWLIWRVQLYHTLQHYLSSDEKEVRKTTMKDAMIQANTSWLEAGSMSTCQTSHGENLPKQIFTKISEAWKWKITENIMKAGKLREKNYKTFPQNSRKRTTWKLKICNKV
jgi:hypothetical protein